MEYPNVKNAHIVPRTYLANFAAGGKIGVYQVVEEKALVRAVENVGTRRRFYERERRDGALINDVEWSLGQGEAMATPVLRAFEELWPLRLEDKHKLAELFAYQLIRSPRFKEEYERMTAGFIDDYKRSEKLAQLEDVTEQEMREIRRAPHGRLLPVHAHARHGADAHVHPRLDALDARRVPVASARDVGPPGCPLAAHRASTTACVDAALSRSS
jgi:hypothetical protein